MYWLKNLCLPQGCEDILLWLCRTFIFQPVKFVCAVDLILIFVYGGRRVTIHSFIQMYVWLTQYYLLVTFSSIHYPGTFFQHLPCMHLNMYGWVCLWNLSYSIGLFIYPSANTILCYLLELLISSSISTQDVFLFFKIVMSIWGVLHFHINLESTCQFPQKLGLNWIYGSI